MTCTLTTECPDAANLRIMLDGTCSHCDDYLMLSADQKTCSEVSCKAQTNTILTKEAVCEHVVDYKVQCPDDQLRECDPVCEDNQMWESDGNCKTCTYKVPSEDRKHCVDPTCEVKQPFNEDGTCGEACPDG